MIYNIDVESIPKALESLLGQDETLLIKLLRSPFPISKALQDDGYVSRYVTKEYGAPSMTGLGLLNFLLSWLVGENLSLTMEYSGDPSVIRGFRIVDAEEGLEDESYYLQVRDVLLRAYENRFVLIHNGGIWGCFDTKEEAKEYGTSLFADAPFLVRQVTSI